MATAMCRLTTNCGTGPAPPAVEAVCHWSSSLCICSDEAGGSVCGTVGDHPDYPPADVSSLLTPPGPPSQHHGRHRQLDASLERETHARSAPATDHRHGTKLSRNDSHKN